MIFKITSVKILDTIRVRYRGILKDVSVLMILKDGKIEGFKILGICEFPGNPMSGRSPRDDLEREILEKIEKVLSKEDVDKYLGKEIEI